MFLRLVKLSSHMEIISVHIHSVLSRILDNFVFIILHLVTTVNMHTIDLI